MKDDLKEQKDSIIAIIGIIFFIGLAIFARTSNTKQKETPTGASPTPTQTPAPSQEVSDPIEKFKHQNNYQFRYTIIENDQVEMIEGKSYGNKKKFSIIGTKREEYGKQDENYYLFNGSNYSITETPIRSYFPYITIENIMDIIDLSMEKIEKEDYIYAVDITDLFDKYTETDYDGFQEFKDDSIKIHVEDEQVTKMEIDYSNYFTYINKQETTFKVQMEFSEFDKVEDFEINS